MENQCTSTAEMLRDIFIDYCPEPQRLNWDEAMRELKKIEKHYHEKNRKLTRKAKYKPLILQI